MDFAEFSSLLRRRDGDDRQLTANGRPDHAPAATELAPRDTLLAVSLKIAALMAAVGWASATMASWLI